MNNKLDWIMDQMRQSIEDKTPVAPIVFDPWAVLDDMPSVDKSVSVVSLYGAVVADRRAKASRAAASKTACGAAS